MVASRGRASDLAHGLVRQEGLLVMAVRLQSAIFDWIGKTLADILNVSQVTFY